ncbi:serine hydrolase domain-containing protein [Cytobacillus purgationiresistens]|uniref:CubicO group peptidase (Beta-lactamase class C family) n=1 Tax=Cytobacillus purgationiresistens TaxID=863449 RepID=A0ABU0AE73_9BACI|nr:serine hydrolase domain-containing protein [Cytobacillus purgationiresistens]MDQ0269551.1 CubicO group peptidase (beta-lactamase class C family) [Cytobacillus purgationiresistens]
MNISERMEHYQIPGLSLAIIENGQISSTESYGVLEAGRNQRVNDQTIFNACSISKFLTSVLIMKLSEEGILDLDEDVNQKLTAWKVPNNTLTINNKVTLRNLLSHQSGIIDPKGSFMRMNPKDSTPDMVEILNGDTPYCNESINIIAEPGSTFQYSDAGYCIIQQLIEDVMGQSFHTEIFERIFEPLKMTNSIFELKVTEKQAQNLSCGHNRYGKRIEGNYPFYPNPAGAGLWTSSSDLALLVNDIIHSLYNESRLGLSQATIKEMISPQGDIPWAGLGVFIEGKGHNVEFSSLGWGEGFQSMIVSYPYVKTAAVIMTNADLGVHQMKGIIGEIYQSLTFEHA